MFLGLVISVLLPKIVDFRGEKCRGYTLLLSKNKIQLKCCGKMSKLKKSYGNSTVSKPKSLFHHLKLLKDIVLYIQ